MAKIIIPTPLRKFTANQASFDSNGSTTVNEAITELVEEYSDLGKQLLDLNGELRSFVRVYLGDEDIKSLDKGDTAVSSDSVISIIPAIAGGSY